MFNGFDLSTISNCYIGSTAASAIYYGSQLIWPTTPPPHDYSQDYLTIVSTSNNNSIGWKCADQTQAGVKSISISTDNGTTWTQYTSTYAGTLLTTLNNGDKMLIKSTDFAGTSIQVPNSFTSTGSFNVEGTFMSIVYGDNFLNWSFIGNDTNFVGLFGDCIYLVSAENLILSATTIRDFCYESLFNGCTSLIAAPELPATDVGSLSYAWMFCDCVALINPPVMPSTLTIHESTCEAMFKNCTSMTTSPSITFTNATQYAFQDMFNGCVALTTAPEIHAAKLKDCSCRRMFKGCSSLNYIKCLATDISGTYCTTDWVDGVAATGTFVKDASMTSWTTGIDGIPSGWTLQNA